MRAPATCVCNANSLCDCVLREDKCVRASAMGCGAVVLDLWSLFVWQVTGLPLCECE
jgi:hypothetical protein